MIISYGSSYKDETHHRGELSYPDKAMVDKDFDGRWREFFASRIFSVSNNTPYI